MIFTLSQASGKTDKLWDVPRARVSSGGEVAEGRWYIDADGIVDIMEIIAWADCPVIVSANNHIVIYDDYMES